VIAGGDEKHADFIGEETDERVIPLEREEEDAKASEMNEKKRDAGNEL